MIGNVETTVGRVIALEVDGVPQPAGQLIEHRRARFAYRDDADAWLDMARQFGFDGHVGALACSYFGPSDSPSNCWEVSVEKEIGL